MAEGSKQIETIEVLELTLSDGASAGFVKNSATGVLSGGNSGGAADDTAYNATTWNANTDAATKNAIRDQVEVMIAAEDLNTTHRADNTQAHSDYLLNNADDTSSGKITAANVAITADNTTVDVAYVPMVLFNTDATPPTASNFVKGTIYIQYTA